MITAISNQCKKGVAVDGYVRTVETYGGQFDGALEALTARFPCVFVEFGGFDQNPLASKGTAALAYRRNISFNVFVAAENLRSEQKARRATGGTYEMIEDVSDALAGKQLSLVVGALDLDRVDLIENLPGISAYQMIFKTFTKHGTDAS